MSQTLVLEVPDDVFETLKAVAGERGQSPEAASIEWLAEMVRIARQDPLEEFIGALPSQFPDWAERHDDYLGRALAEESRDEPEAPHQGE